MKNLERLIIIAFIFSVLCWGEGLIEALRGDKFLSPTSTVGGRLFILSIFVTYFLFGVYALATKLQSRRNRTAQLNMINRNITIAHADAIKTATSSIELVRPESDNDPLLDFGKSGLKLSDFKIGDEFRYTDMNALNRVTDIGSRTLCYIRLDRGEDTSWYNGPPYGCIENVADEHDLEAIEKIEKKET